MSIILIDGPSGSGKSTVANAVKEATLKKGRSALVLDEGDHDRTQQDEPRADERGDSAAWLVQRLLAVNPFPGHGRQFLKGKDDPEWAPSQPNPDFEPGGLKEDTVYDVRALPWKRDVTIIVVGDEGKAMLARMEKVVPGLRAYFGPEFTFAAGGAS